jgi:hypothetical protein
MIATTIPRARQKVDPRPLPPLCEGDRLSQPEFHRRYLAMPQGVKAELVEGIVVRSSRDNRR